MANAHTNNTKDTLKVNEKNYSFFSLEKFSQMGSSITHLPRSLRILLENLLRFEDGKMITSETIRDFCHGKTIDQEITFFPSRVLMQDFTGIPAVADLAAMRDAFPDAPQTINPLIPVDLVVDHSITVDYSGTPDAKEKNEMIEANLNKERYSFLKWGQNAFQGLRIIPPGAGICHQVNLEYLASVVMSRKEKDGSILVYPDTLVGTDSHTTMINALGVLGWGVGGIEAEAAMLGQPVSMQRPEVVGVCLRGAPQSPVLSTDIVLKITEFLRSVGVVGKFVEFFGSGLEYLTQEDRATIANMAPEYGATCAFFPTDQATLSYLRKTGRSEEQIHLVEAYTKKQKIFYDAQDDKNIQFDSVYTVDLSEITLSIAGPKRPQDRIPLHKAGESCNKLLEGLSPNNPESLSHGSVVLAAITSCTNTSNPALLLAAGILAKKAREHGLMTKPWVKTSFAPGSKVAPLYLNRAGLMTYLEELGFHIVGYGCTTCIGNSGNLLPHAASEITKQELQVAAVLSGNRNFEGRIHPQIPLNYLASPPLVVAYAIAGRANIDFEKEPLGLGHDGHPVYLKDIFPSYDTINTLSQKVIAQSDYIATYQDILSGNDAWQKIQVHQGAFAQWDKNSTYIQKPTFFESEENKNRENWSHARPLLILGDSVTTDHISPAGVFKESTPAGQYLVARGVAPKDFNSYGSRRGNHEIMVRGTFANTRIKNLMLSGQEGGFTRLLPEDKIVSVYDAAMAYKKQNVPVIVVAGKEYGTGSSRDWAAKGPRLLSVQAIIAESFERIHRSNLVGMGILPLQMTENTLESLHLTGLETFSLRGSVGVRAPLFVHILYADQTERLIPVQARIDTMIEMDYYHSSGILSYCVGLKKKTR